MKRPLIQKLIQKEINSLTDDAYRYRHIGKGPVNIAYAEKLEAKVEELKKEL